MSAFLLKFAVSLLVIYGLIIAAAFLGQRRLMYFPDRARIAPLDAGLTGVEERLIETADGERLVTWHLPARLGKPTILYFHGNAGGLAMRAERVKRFAGEGYGVTMMAYRSYAGSTGSPSEAANVADALLVYDRLVKSGVRADDIVVYGESLGSGVAVQVAGERPVKAVVLDAPYTSTVDVAAQVYPFLPVRALMKDRYESSRHIARVKAPLLVIHGERDRVIPVAMGRSLFAIASEPKRLVTFPEGGHSDLYLHGALDVIRDWLRGLDGATAR